MKRDNTEELIQQLLDLSLSHEEKTSFERRLESDALAREELNRYRKVLEALDALESVEPPVDFTAKIMSALPEVSFQEKGKIPESESSILSLKKLFPWAGGATVLVASFAVALVVFQKDSPQMEKRPELFTQAFEIAASSKTSEAASGASERKGTGLKSAPTLVAKASLEVLEGVVKVKKNNGEVLLVRRGELNELDFQDEIETGYHATARIVWPEDDVKLNLKSRTRVQVAQNSIRLHHGDTWVHVLKKGMHFEVQTPNLVAAVRGTMFATNVRYSTFGVQQTLFDRLSAQEMSTDALESTHSQLQKALGFVHGMQDVSLSDPMYRSSEVSVFEGVVEVSSLVGHDQSEMLFAGDSVAQVLNGLSQKQDIEPRVWLRWKNELDTEGIVLAPEAVQASTAPGMIPSDLEIKHEIMPVESFERDFQE